jgi:CelD/BcsL family acetyltransferase involved in cellulose biosynthesis
MWDVLGPPGLMQLLLAERRSAGTTTLLAGSLFLMSEHTVSYAFNGRRRDALSLGPNDALQWEALRKAAQVGVRRYDFGQAAGSASLAAYKMKWGAVRTPSYTFSSAAASDGRRRQRPGRARAQLAVLRMGKATWAHLPLALTATAGDVLRRYA